MSKNNNILIFNQHSSYITIDIANAIAFANPQSNITLFTGVVNVRMNPLNERIRIIKTLKYNKHNIFTRLFSWFFAFFHFILIVNIKFRNTKLLLVSNPPLISFLPYFTANRYDVLIFDIYPDALEGSGFVSRSSFIYRFWEKSNIRLYKRAERIFTISEGMKQRLARYAAAEKIKVINLWSSFSPNRISKTENIFVSENLLNDKFIVMFSGNMGKGSGLDSLLLVADQLRQYEDIVFLFVGDGWMLKSLKQSAEKSKLTNCRFLPYQRVEILQHSLSAADIAIVTLAAGADSISIPNKTYTLIALGKPILGITPSGSDLYDLIYKYKIGECFEYGEVDKMSEFILRMKTNPHALEEYSANCMQCSNEFTSANASFFV